MAAVEDRRVDRTKAHDLQDILVLSVLAVLAVLCGADGWEYIELFADGGADYVLARNRGQSPHDSVKAPSYGDEPCGVGKWLKPNRLVDRSMGLRPVRYRMPRFPRRVKAPTYGDEPRGVGKFGKKPGTVPER